MSGVITGNVQSLSVVSIALSPSIVAANTTAEQTFTVPGVLASDAVVTVNKPAAQAGIGIVGWRVSAAGTVAVTFVNSTAGGLTPTAAEVYKFVLVRSDSVQSGFSV